MHWNRRRLEGNTFSLIKFVSYGTALIDNSLY